MYREKNEFKEADGFKLCVINNVVLVAVEQADNPVHGPDQHPVHDPRRDVFHPVT